MKQAFVDYYRCPNELVDFQVITPLKAEAGYFNLGDKGLYFGQHNHQQVARNPSQSNPNLLLDCQITPEGRCLLPFNPTEVCDNLRLERYMSAAHANIFKRLFSYVARKAYYIIRPYMPVHVRKYLQRRALKGWDKIPFPSWPVDTSIDQMMHKLLYLNSQLHPKGLPFIWFWPEGYEGAVIISHDIETQTGRNFCSKLMDMTEAHNFRSSFQFIPEKRYERDEKLLNEIRSRGFEVNIHGLNHDGHLFDNYQEFYKRAQKINEYARDYQAEGFRSPVMYRNPDWFKDLDFSYDMSMPNVAHLDPQRGGCCTVMPYFIDHIVELPLTTTQDYPLFNILQRYNLDLWKQQCQEIIGSNGLISILIHPDYVIESRTRALYETLLAYLSKLAKTKNLWRALPKDVAQWWRQRSRMQLYQDREGQWKIRGEGSEQARVAFARIENQEIVYDFEQ